MKDREKDVQGRAKERASFARQPLVVRHSEQESELGDFGERLQRLEEMTNAMRSPARPAPENKQSTRLDGKALVALGAIMLSIAGYVIQDARNTSRQDTDMEATKIRLTNLEKIAATNTESRIRSEVELSELRRGQAEIKDMLRAHEDDITKVLHKK
jgi:hypothetical protein